MWQRNYYKIRKVVYIDERVGEHTNDLRIEIMEIIECNLELSKAGSLINYGNWSLHINTSKTVWRLASRQAVN